MLNHWKYLKYVTRHRWYVFVECCKLWIPWRGILHDLSKYSYKEWFAYVEAFYGEFGYSFDSNRDLFDKLLHKEVMEAFDYAWLHHQKKNPHHWQYWLLQNDEDGLYPLEMPIDYAKEMVADWKGASRAIKGYDDTINWYERNKDKIQLHERTREYVEYLISGE